MVHTMLYNRAPSILSLLHDCTEVLSVLEHSNMIVIFVFLNIRECDGDTKLDGI